MNDIQDHALDSLILKVKSAEMNRRRSTVLLSLLPAALGVLGIVFASVSITRLNQQKTALQATVTELTQEAESLRNSIATEKANLKDQQDLTQEAEKKLEDTQEQLNAGLSLKQFLHPLDMADYKSLYASGDLSTIAQSSLSHIYDFYVQGGKWKKGGYTREKGFDSPNFAAFILRQCNLPLAGPDKSLTSTDLLEMLEPTDKAVPGSLIVYEQGYVMFYFEDVHKKSFVIGMTPFGVIALDYHFAQEREIRLPALKK